MVKLSRRAARRGMVQSCCKLGSTRRTSTLNSSTGGARLVVVALETGGRWSNEAVDIIWQLAQAKARESALLHDTPNGIGVGAPLDEDAEQCAVVSFTGSLVEPSQHADVCTTEGEMPSLSEVLTHDPI